MNSVKEESDSKYQILKYRSDNCYFLEDLRAICLSTKMFDVFNDNPPTDFSYQKIKFMSFIQMLGPVFSVYVRTHPNSFGPLGNPIMKTLMYSNFDDLITHEEQDQFYRVKYVILTITTDGTETPTAPFQAGVSKGIGRIIFYENMQGVYRIRFFYDGEVRAILKNNQKIIERDGFGRYTDVMGHKFAIGFWKQDYPFGKQIVYKQKLNNAIDIYREGHFFCDWNKYTNSKILSSFSKSDKEMEWSQGAGFEDNLGPHANFDFSEESISSLNDRLLDKSLQMLKNRIKTQKELE